MFSTGKLCWCSNGDGEYDIIGFEDDGGRISELLEEFSGKQVWCNYAFSTEPLTPELVLQAAIDTAEGEVDARYSVAWSEITGYLWTNNDGNIGGHDMIAIFEQHVGEYAALIVEVEPINLADYVSQ